MNNFRKDCDSHKVLMIAQYFPPAGGVGTFRVTKFVKYLRLYRWEPIVLTVREDYYRRYWCIDDSLIGDIPGDIKMHRTKLCDQLFLNDAGIRWIPFLVVEAARIIRKERPALLYITADPFFPLVIGPVMKKIFGLEYVVDLRDPWKLAYQGKVVRGRMWVKAKIVRLLSCVLEPFVIRNASKVICVSSDMCEEYRREYSKIHRNKFQVITNGYDEEDYCDIDPVRYEQFTIVYTGKFFAGAIFRDPENFFRGLRILRDRNIKLKFVHVGKIEEDILRMLENIGISDMVKCVGQISYRECIAYAKGADLLLLIGGGEKSEQTGKIFDYLGCNRPILALARRDGGIAEVVRDIPSARILENDNPELIASTIMEMYQRPSESMDRKGDFSKYSRRGLTRILSDSFDEIVNMRLKFH